MVIVELCGWQVIFDVIDWVDVVGVQVEEGQM